MHLREVSGIVLMCLGSGWHDEGQGRVVYVNDGCQSV